MTAKWQATGMNSSRLKVGLSAFCLEKTTNAQMHRDIYLHNSLWNLVGEFDAYTEAGYLITHPDLTLNSYSLSYGLEDTAYAVELPVPVWLWAGCTVHGLKHKPRWDTSWKPELLVH